MVRTIASGKTSTAGNLLHVANNRQVWTVKKKKSYIHEYIQYSRRLNKWCCRHVIPDTHLHFFLLFCFQWSVISILFLSLLTIGLNKTGRMPFCLLQSVHFLMSSYNEKLTQKALTAAKYFFRPQHLSLNRCWKLRIAWRRTCPELIKKSTATTYNIKTARL